MTLATRISLMFSVRKGAFLPVIFCALIACTGTSPSHDIAKEVDEKSGASVLTEHQFSVSAKKAKRIGEDCSLHGSSECLSGVCLHTSPHRHAGYICSQTCSSTSDCPANWSCVQGLLGEVSGVCMPNGLNEVSK